MGGGDLRGERVHGGDLLGDLLAEGLLVGVAVADEVRLPGGVLPGEPPAGLPAADDQYGDHHKRTGTDPEPAPERGGDVRGRELVAHVALRDVEVPPP